MNNQQRHPIRQPITPDEDIDEFWEMMQGQVDPLPQQPKVPVDKPQQDQYNKS